MRHSISYVSTVDSRLTDLEIKNLLLFVKETNMINNITGIFIYSEGNFFQVIEGETKKVEALFEKIYNDTRHYNIIKILDKKIEDITFSKYYSYFTIMFGASKHRELQHFLKREQTHNPEHFKNISYLTHKFLKLS